MQAWINFFNQVKLSKIVVDQIDFRWLTITIFKKYLPRLELRDDVLFCFLSNLGRLCDETTQIRIKSVELFLP